MGQIHPDHVAAPQKALFYDGTFYLPAKADADGRVIVRGENQLHSFKAALAFRRRVLISGEDGYIDSATVTAGEVWVVTNIAVWDETTATTLHMYYLHVNGKDRGFATEEREFAIGRASYFHHWLWMPADSVVRVYIVGAEAGDACEVILTGYTMDAE